ncbi:hypothetical protein ADP71_31380 [Vitreoscilla sp. C1]|uniref:hypothetical protein n=1 Tax=Vitreoscilla sp. (strain C1) TaxID=96942 RepID=UPI000CDCB2A4|nr:hypothetical protein [Vitreoscilla sp. C1]AUZ06316.1 hypothetical protein ADP71_31380 [Vitreoscilla sp. C1]
MIKIEPVLIKQKTAMEIADIKSVNTLKKRIAAGEFPEPIYKEGRRWYSYAAVKAALEAEVIRLSS